MWIPEGSTSGPIVGGKVTVTLPEGWDYVGTSGGVNRPTAPKTVEITCTCTSSGDCNPVYTGGHYGCEALSGCTACSMKVKMFDRVGSGSAVYESGGLYLANGTVTFLTDAEEILPCVFPELMALENVNTAVQNFLAEVYGSTPVPTITPKDGIITAPDGYVVAPIKIFGRVGAVIVPNSARPTGGGTKGTCACVSAGGGECELKTSGFGSIYTCTTNDCTSCRLRIVTNDITVYEAESYQF